MLGLMIRLNNEVRDMGENGMHSNPRGRHSRPSAQSSSPAVFTVGFNGIRKRAKLSNAEGYSPSDAPRQERPNLSTRSRHHDLENREN